MKRFLSSLLAMLMLGCGINSVTKAELESLKAGDVLIYRHRIGGKSWMYGNKITRIEGDTVYFVPSTKTATSKRADIATFEAKTPEESIKKADLLKFETKQGDDEKMIIEIRPS